VHLYRLTTCPPNPRGGTAIKVGGRGQWRVEDVQLEAYIQRMYTQTKRFVEAHPLSAPGSDGVAPTAHDHSQPIH